MAEIIWQTCPICYGSGLVGGGHFDAPGNIDDYGNRLWVSDHASEQCRRCKGVGTIVIPSQEDIAEAQRLMGGI